MPNQEKERWFGCPLCGRVDRTSAGLLAQGCEGKHMALIPEQQARQQLAVLEDALAEAVKERERYADALCKVEFETPDLQTMLIATEALKPTREAHRDGTYVDPAAQLCRAIGEGER